MTAIAIAPPVATKSTQQPAKHPSAPQPPAVVSVNGHHHENQNGQMLPLSTLKMREPKQRSQHTLPTFPWDVGYRLELDEQTQKWIQHPLRLMDILYPYENDKGHIQMAQSPIQFSWNSLLVEMIRPEVRPQGWLVLGDVLCYWEYPGVPAQAPDLAFFYGVESLDEERRSYHVGIDGPLPDFVIEITSFSTRTADLETKPYTYAALGIYEFLIIDMQTPESENWRLLGYRLGDHPIYQSIEPDTDGGITIESIGMRFVAVGRQRIDVYEAATGRRLLSAEEQKLRADTEAARADTEAARAEAESRARVAAETRAEQAGIVRSQLEAELAKTKARLSALGIED